MSKYRPPLRWPPLKRRAAPLRAWDRVRRFTRQNGLNLLYVAVAVGIVGYWYKHRYDPSTVSTILTPNAIDDALHVNPLWRRPSTAPNGKPWPVVSRLLEGYPQLNVSGRASIVADNSGGTADMFVKLIDRDRVPMTAVRVGFVTAKGELTMRKVKPGHYDLRYMNLFNGRIRKSEPIEVTLKTTENGQEYMGWRIGMFGVIDGDAQHEDISAKEF